MSVKDDISVIEPVFQSVKRAFREGKTKDLEFRKRQLDNLARGIKELTL